MPFQTWQAPPGDLIPNHPDLLVRVHRDVTVVHEGIEPVRATFAEHGWGGTWVDGVFDFHHFHSTSHEALAVLSGSATIALGGPQGESFDVRAGDVLVLPAGTGHRRLHASGDFSVLGAYPAGQEDYDVLREADDAARERIAAVPWPATDPLGA